MSPVISATPLGRFRKVTRDGVEGWLFECPGCGEWGQLDADQWAGKVSADHTGQNKARDCVYHETHDYRAALDEALGAGRVVTT